MIRSGPVYPTYSLMFEPSRYMTPGDFQLRLYGQGPMEMFERAQQSLASMRHQNLSDVITTRRIFIRALGAQGQLGELSIPMHRTIMEDSTAPERYEAALSFWKITGRSDEMMEILEPLVLQSRSIDTSDPRYGIISILVGVLGELGESGVSLLAEMTGFEDYDLRLKAYLVLEPLASRVPEARRLLEAAQGDSHASIRLRARKALERND